MPKLLEMVREKALRKAREILLGPDGYEALTMRAVAAELKVGVGTLYNYFPSKEHLIASVMLEDWQEAGRSLEEKLARLTLPETLAAVYAFIADFSRRYEPVWTAAPPARTEARRQQYHSALVEQICGYLSARRKDAEAGACRFTAELLLYFASSGHPYADVEPYVRKLLEA